MPYAPFVGVAGYHKDPFAELPDAIRPPAGFAGRCPVAKGQKFRYT